MSVFTAQLRHFPKSARLFSASIHIFRIKSLINVLQFHRFFQVNSSFPEVIPPHFFGTSTTSSFRSVPVPVSTEAGGGGRGLRRGGGAAAPGWAAPGGGDRGGARRGAADGGGGAGGWGWWMFFRWWFRSTM